MTFLNKVTHLRVLLIIGLLSSTLHTVQAQKKQQNLQYEDLKPYHFGFLIGVHNQDLIPTHSGVADADGNRWYGSVNQYEPGFTVGIVGDVRLSENFSLRSTPSIHFGSKKMTLYPDNASLKPVVANIRSNYVLIPLLVRYRGFRNDNYRPYVLSGFSVGVDMGRDKLEPLLLKPANLYWEIGAGMDFYMHDFKLVPELKLCLGIGDILVHKRNDQTEDSYEKYAKAFDAITSRLFVFSLQFE